MKNTTIEYAQQAQVDLSKLKWVIASCNTKEQLKCAWKYYKLWQKKYSHWLDVIHDRALIYMDGIAMGMFLGRLKDEIYVKRTIPGLEKF